MPAFRVSIDYLEWAHGSAAEDGQPRAVRLIDAPGYQMKFKLFTEPELVAEIADVAELYIGGGDNDLRAARVFARARKWLWDEHRLTVKQALNKNQGDRHA